MRLLLMITFAIAGMKAYSQSKGVKEEFKKLEWLIGTWNRTNTKPGRTANERWEKIKDYELRGFGVSFKGSDTAYVEKIKIVMRNDTIYYVADVPENNTLVYFKVTMIGEDGFVCENPRHDFPKKIAYYRKDQSLKAQISGDGKEIDYFFERED